MIQVLDKIALQNFRSIILLHHNLESVNFCIYEALLIKLTYFQDEPISDVGMMDFYITDSLHDMLDYDVRSDLALLGNSGDVPLSLFSDLTPLELDMQSGSKYNYYNGLEDDNLINNLDLSGNDGDVVMVDPSSVMPVLYSEVRPAKARFGILNSLESPLSSPDCKKHLTFSPKNVKISATKTYERTASKTAIKDLQMGEDDFNSEVSSKKKPLLSSSPSTKLNVKSTVIKTEKIIQVVENSASSQVNHSPCSTPVRNEIYPKPAYSYSCLIALALKNSQYGCLPVSEIYSFMWYVLFLLVHIF